MVDEFCDVVRNKIIESVVGYQNQFEDSPKHNAVVSSVFTSQRCINKRIYTNALRRPSCQTFSLLPSASALLRLLMHARPKGTSVSPTRREPQQNSVPQIELGSFLHLSVAFKRVLHPTFMVFRVARIFVCVCGGGGWGGGGGCVWAVKVQTCRGVRGHAPPGKF